MEEDYRLDKGELALDKILAIATKTKAKWESFLAASPKLYPKETQFLTEHSKLRNLSPEYFESEPDLSKEDDEVEKYLIKWKGVSYIHCSWETKRDLLALLPGTLGESYLNGRIAAFEKTQKLFNLDSLDSFTKIHRVLDFKKDSEDVTKDMFLIKFNNCPYDELQHETREDLLLKNTEEELRLAHDNFIKRHNSSNRKPRHNKRYSSRMTFKNGMKLRDYQVEAVNWLTFNWTQERNSILADEMGLGKTCQTVSFIHRLYYGLKISSPFLIIAPLSTLNQWEQEFEKWSDFNCIVYHGSKDAKKNIKTFEIKPGFDVLVTNYDTALMDMSYITRFQWELVVIDEAHRLKNSQSSLAKVLKKNLKLHVREKEENSEEVRVLKARMLLLTGTPIQNNYEELWSLLNFIEPANFPALNEFLAKWQNMQSAKDMDNFQEMLSPYMLRRLKKHVEKLPPKIDTLIEVELTTLQKKFYRAIYEKNRNYLSKLTRQNKQQHEGLKLERNVHQVSLKNISVQLRKCCYHPYLLNGVEETVLAEAVSDYKKQYKVKKIPQNAYHDLIMKNLIASSGKMILIDKLLPKLKAEGHRVLLFSQWTGMLNIIQDYLVGKGYSFERIDGDVSSQKRELSIKNFNATARDTSVSEPPFIFLLSTRAAGMGLNLTAADTIILYDLDWNPQSDMQALARCHRIGQKKTVQIYRMITRKSYEEHMFHTQSRKLGLDLAVMSRLEKETEPDEQVNAKKKTKKDADKETERLLRYGAYVLKDDNDEDAKGFEQEDIDVILRKRARKINVDESKAGDKGVELSKARFIGNKEDENKNLDVDDPEFWNKVMGEEQLKEFNQHHNSNIIFGKRKRKQVVYTAPNFAKEYDSEEDEDFEVESEAEEEEDKPAIDEQEVKNLDNKLQAEMRKTAFKPKTWQRHKKKVYAQPGRGMASSHARLNNQPASPSSSTHKRFLANQPNAVGKTSPPRILNKYNSLRYGENILTVLKHDGVIVHPCDLFRIYIYEPELYQIQNLKYRAQLNQGNYHMNQGQHLFQTIKQQDVINPSLSQVPNHIHKLLRKWLKAQSKGAKSLEIAHKVLDTEAKKLNFRLEALQQEVEYILKAACMYVVNMLENFARLSYALNTGKLTNEHIDSNEEAKDIQVIDLTEAKTIDKPTKTFMPTSGDVNLAAFRVTYPQFMQNDFVERVLQGMGYKHLSAFFSRGRGIPQTAFCSPLRCTWLTAEAFEIVANLEASYENKHQQQIQYYR
eukprot:augustus_masked-scaffold_1-processed-gene-9.8-mRNA-1 protein AED:0.23 eAED:0.24 QI:255/0/0/0.33/1/1/3/0/1246